MEENFRQLPSEEELIASSRYIDKSIAEQILYLASSWGGSDSDYELRLVNQLVGRIDYEEGDWNTVRWNAVVEWMKQMDAQIHGLNTMVYKQD